MRIPRTEGESVRKKLLESGLLDSSLVIRRQGDDLLLPIVDPEPLREMDLLLEDFETKEVSVTDYRELVDLPDKRRDQLPTSYDVIGDIAIIRLPENLIDHAGMIGNALMKAFPRLRTVALDRGVQGEYRVRDLEVVSGRRSTVTTHTEFGLRFKVDVAKVYYNPRLAAERRRVSSLVKGREEVIDMFAGVGSFSIMIARHASPKIVRAIDLNPVAVELMRENIRLNKADGVIALQGDAREVISDLPEADRIIMNLPHSAHEYLGDAAMRLRIGGMIHLYLISDRSEIETLLEDMINELTMEHIGFELVRRDELKTYSPSMSIYSLDLMLTSRPRC